MKCIFCQGNGCMQCHRTGHKYLTGYDESNERYTPKFLIDVALACMGCIDTDPATSEIANRTVKATTIYTFRENGLNYPWRGRVWCNPPFGYAGSSQVGYQELFTSHGIRQYKLGNMQEGIFLLSGNAVYREWFQRTLFCYPTCFYQGDVYFTRPYTSETHHGFGTIMTYIGYRPYHFVHCFSRLGHVAYNPLEI